MKFLTILFLSLFYFIPFSYGQSNIASDYARVDSIMNKLPDSISVSSTKIANFISSNFSTTDDKARAVYYWVSNNIAYDVTKMNSKNIIIENDDDNIESTLKSKKGICSDYATLFTDLCTKVGIQSLIVEGYVIKSNSLNYLSHAWNTVYIDSAWYMFDATWAAGYVKRDKFIKERNNKYFKVEPNILFASHIPFNYLFQFSNNPISHEEFNNGDKNASLKIANFNYLDSIKKYQSNARFDRNISEYNCIKNYKGRNLEIISKANDLKLSIEVDKSNMIVFAYNTSINDYNEGIKEYNKFIAYRNNKLMPTKSDKEIQGMLTSVKIKFDDAEEKLLSIKNADQNFEKLVNKQLTKVIDGQKLVKEQQDWLTIYLSKNTKDRKWMFYQK